MELGFFEIVRDAFEGFAAEGFAAEVDGHRHVSVHGRGIKVWFGDHTREHYEAQLVRVDDAVQLEIGFHSEHPKAPQNDAVLQRLIAAESSWRPELGDEAIAGDFIGRVGWRRISELWPAPTDEAVDDAIDTAARLADYVLALEPVRRASAG